MTHPKKAQGQTSSRSKLSDAERHKRFVETAETVGASEMADDFDNAFKRVVRQSGSDGERPKRA